MLLQFTRSQNLRALLQPQNVSPAIHGLLSAYRKIFTSDLRGTLLHDALSYDESYTRMDEEVTWSRKDEKRLSSTVYELLVDWVCHRGERQNRSGQKSESSKVRERCSARCFKRNHIKWLGQTFNTHTIPLLETDRVIGNSLIVFPDENGDGSWAAGRISEIFSHTHQDSTGADKTFTFFVIEQYSALREDHIQFDNYRKFPVLGGRIFYNAFNPQLVLRSAEEILGHFGYTARNFPGIEEDCIHVYPFIKVCDSYQFLHTGTYKLRQ